MTLTELSRNQIMQKRREAEKPASPSVGKPAAKKLVEKPGADSGETEAVEDG